MNRYYWTAYSNQQRTSAIYQIEEIINKYGYIIHFQRFSDISMSMTIEIEEIKVKPLFDALKTIIKLNEIDEITASANTDCTIFLNITFTKGTGYLKIDVPAVPG